MHHTLLIEKGTLGSCQGLQITPWKCGSLPKDSPNQKNPKNPGLDTLAEIRLTSPVDLLNTSHYFIWFLRIGVTQPNPRTQGKYLRGKTSPNLQQVPLLDSAATDPAAAVPLAPAVATARAPQRCCRTWPQGHRKAPELGWLSGDELVVGWEPYNIYQQQSGWNSC